MDEAKRELVRAWLIKARNDLTTAREIGALRDGQLGRCCHHIDPVRNRLSLSRRIRQP